MEPDEPVKPPSQVRNLEPLSISELENYIRELNGEIARAEAMINAKRAHRGGADSIFKR